MKWVQLIPSVRPSPKVRPLTALTLSSGPSHWKLSKVLQGSFLVFWGPLHAQLPIIYSLIVLKASVTVENPRIVNDKRSLSVDFCEKLFWVNTCRCESVASVGPRRRLLRLRSLRPSSLFLDFLSCSCCETLYAARARNEVTASSQSNPVITMNVALMSPRAVCQRIPCISAASHKPAGISSPPRGHQLIVSWAFSPTYSSVQAPPSRALVHIPGPVKSRMSQDGTDRQSRILLQLFAHFKDGVECQASAACGALAGPYGGAGGHLLSSNSLLWLNMCD